MKTESEVRRGTATRRAAPADRDPRARRVPAQARPPKPVPPSATGHAEPPVPAPAPVVAGEAAVRRSRAPRAPFVLLVVGLLCGGLVSLLLLNTVLAQDSFELNKLRSDNQQIREQAEATRNLNASLGGPDAVDRRARRLGVGPDPSAPEFVTPASSGGRTASKQERPGAAG
jgi:hypothetical protein